MRVSHAELADHGGLERAAGEEAAGNGGNQAGHKLGFDHRLKLAGRPGQQHDQLAMPVVYRVEPLTGRRAVRVRERFSTLDDIALLGVVVGDLDAACGEACIQGGDNLLIAP